MIIRNELTFSPASNVRICFCDDCFLCSKYLFAFANAVNERSTSILAGTLAPFFSSSSKGSL